MNRRKRFVARVENELDAVAVHDVVFPRSAVVYQDDRIVEVGTIKHVFEDHVVLYFVWIGDLDRHVAALSCRDDLTVGNLDVLDAIANVDEIFATVRDVRRASRVDQCKLFHAACRRHDLRHSSSRVVVAGVRS
eukprot:2115372-Rhodomonas_salina.1